MTDEGRKIDSMSRAVGSLEGKVESLDDKIKTLTDNWQVNDGKATEGRRALYHEFKQLKDALVEALGKVQLEINNISHRVESIAGKVAGIEPQVLTTHNEHLQRVGSRKALAKVWATFLGAMTLAASLGAGLATLIQTLWPVKPPFHP